ncbi:hypothetical protein EH243_15130 [Amphritea opalescens]|uniref:Uncharacterized protein n=1 Tax=Amphritea opalescens TaxID=2490544 RepID=A0A430KMZ1_9GAMM|nr:hypothetical protein [Amphritea opalescens]RTE64858.1 hypothetical protein EH243_15130 [Amphritea opalescens]
MRHLLVFVLIGIISGCSTGGEDLKPFTSDGCSSFPNGTRAENTLWLSCCEQHDLAYWQGGTYQQRLDADNELKACVAGVGKPEVAMLMLAGVRVGGSPFWPTKFRWGYGWSYFKPYGELSASEQAQVKKLLPLKP